MSIKAMIKNLVEDGMNFQKAITSLKSVVKMLDEAAGKLDVNDIIRRKLVSKRQDLEDIIHDLESR